MEEFFLQKPIKEIECKNSIVWGNKNGKVKIRIFNDFLCGYCKIASEKYRDLFRNDNRVKIEFISFPLNYKKNRNQGSKNINVFVVKAMLAASRQKDFWHFHDLTIKQSDNLDSTKVFEIASKVLDNFKYFKNDFISKNYDSIILENILTAQEYKISGTPTIFINGREFHEWTNINLLKLIINRL